MLSTALGFIKIVILENCNYGDTATVPLRNTIEISNLYLLFILFLIIYMS